ncbi:hypothetical protein RISK_001665 [Rhodopirellula islandica]|uniref:Uncharacterized protein n=1 Tax=Rhodopirellula islandica TaxID=595434 RepID=A0A0J1ELQ8_RHOIS|nr:hypothetical protein RISK_001665 [Rhodopirellula islandica]
MFGSVSGRLLGGLLALVNHSLHFGKFRVAGVFNHAVSIAGGATYLAQNA